MLKRSELARWSVVAGLSLALLTSNAALTESTPRLNNVAPLTVRTPHRGFNRMVVSVTVCAPGTGRCATIDDVMVDTGSTGLRLEASAVPSSLRLPAFVGPESKPLAECLRFVHDTAWGPLHRTNLHIGGMTATDLPIQVIADDGGPQPAECPVSTVRPTSNGTLGIGPWLVDCPGDCEQDDGHPGVFVDREGAWSPFRGAVPRAYRLPNPAAAFPGHGNGVSFDLPMPPRDGAAQVVGTLTLGVVAAPDSLLNKARIVCIDGRGHFTTLYGGKAYPDSYIDSGTETNIIPDADLPRCEGMSWAFCAIPDRSFTATMVGRGGAGIDLAFMVGDYRGALERRVGAWDGFAEVNGNSMAFVWGAPVFFGRQVSVIFDGRSVPGRDGVIGPAYGIR